MTRRHGTAPKAARVALCPDQAGGTSRREDAAGYRPGVRRTLAAPAAAALAAAALAAGCTSGSAPEPAPAASPTYREAPRTARPLETPLASASATAQNVSVTVVGLRTRLTSLVGTHAEWLPKGEYERLRVALDNGSATYREFATERLLLVDADGQTHRPDYDAMNIARQPKVAIVPAQGRLEMDLWYDLPKGATVTALRVQELGTDIPLPS